LVALQAMRAMYESCRLVHADLSEYNVLWLDERAWIIDVSQAVEVTHPLALPFLLRDCNNISTVIGGGTSRVYKKLDGTCRFHSALAPFQFFSRAGVRDVSSGPELFHLLTRLGVPEEGTELLSKVTNHFSFEGI
jgi:serine/threonine-protein kinase RIO1